MTATLRCKPQNKINILLYAYSRVCVEDCNETALPHPQSDNEGQSTTQRASKENLMCHHWLRHPTRGLAVYTYCFHHLRPMPKHDEPWRVTLSQIDTHIKLCFGCQGLSHIKVHTRRHSCVEFRHHDRKPFGSRHSYKASAGEFCYYSRISGPHVACS